MRTPTILVLVAISLFETGSAQQKKSDAEHAALMGKVKTVKIEAARLFSKDGKRGEGKKTQLETQSYSQQGALTKLVRFQDGRPTDYFYSYDSSGNRLEFSRTTFGELRIKTEFKYDANGRRIEELQTSLDGLVNRIEFAYDGNGRLSEKRIFNKQGLFARRTYSYGAGPNATEEAEYDSRGALVGKQSYSYETDATGNWIKRTTLAHGTDNGKPYTEPVEVTYRTIAYY
jgi:YD repeat-containing protein